MAKRKFNFSSSRLDTVDTAWFLRQLESIDETEYDELLPGLLALRYFPLIQNVDEWANVYTYKMFKKVGRAKVGSRNADDAPRVTITGHETSQTIKELELSYGWTMSEIQRAARNRTPLDTATVMAARQAMGELIENLLAFGDADLNIQGMLDLTGVDIETPSAKTSGTTWTVNAATDPGKILADIDKVTSQLFQDLKQTEAAGFQRFALLVPTSAYAAIATNPRSSTSDTTILKYAIANNPWIESIEPWRQCDAAGASDDGRLMAFPRTPAWGGALVPQEFSAMNPQERNLEVVVPVRGSCGGGVCRYPIATRYMDGV